MKRYLYILIVAAAVVLFDQYTKQIITESLLYGQGYPVIENFFNIVRVHNHGAAFGFLNNPDETWQFWLFAGIGVIAVIIIFCYAKSAPKGSHLTFTALGMLLGGAAGNFADRLFFGYVIDFLDFHINNKHWPAFNVADIAICAGVIILITCSFRHGRQSKKKARV